MILSKSVGEVEHPMTNEHHRMDIVQTRNKIIRKALNLDENQ